MAEATEFKILTIRRMRNGALDVLVDGCRVSGVSNIETSCDGQGSRTVLVLENAFVHFDVEPIPKNEMN